ncbi:MAG: hypothetical protein LBT79_00250 [Elusimicrobiota bacterium]|nr:hypothetical protein [Elusimicrobiota bacterium]
MQFLYGIYKKQEIINEIDINKCGQQIDVFHCVCDSNKIITAYWLHPTIAAQGSYMGKFHSMTQSNKPFGIIRIIYFYLHRIHKRILWYLR